MDTPSLEDKFRMPRANSDQALLTAARAFADDAEPLKDVFIAHELPSTFLDDLRTEIDAVERAAQAQATGRELSAGAAAQIEAALETALTAVQRLDVIVVNRLRDDR